MRKGIWNNIPYEVNEETLIATLLIKGKRYSTKVPEFVLDRPVRVLESYIQNHYLAVYKLNRVRWTA